MEKSLLDTFYYVHKNFYNITEGVHAEALLRLFPSRLSIKDANLLITIARHEILGTNYSATLAKAVFNEPNAFSNHLKVLEKLDIIERQKDEIDKRRVLIKLSKNGKNIHQHLENYFSGLSKYIQENLTFFQLLSLYKIVVSVHNQVADQTLQTPSIFHLNKLKKSFIDMLLRIFYSFNDKENQFIAQSKYPSLSLNEMRFLMMVYFYEQQKQAFSIEIADELFMPYSTATSLIKVLIAKGFLHREQCESDGRRFPLSIVPSMQSLIEQHMQYRIGVYQQLLGTLSAKNLALTLRGFTLIAEYAKKSIESQT